MPVKMGRTGPLVEPRRGPQAGKSGDPRSQDADNTPLAPWVFIARRTSSVLKSIKVFNPIKTKSQRENLIHHNKIERGKHHMIQLY